MSITEVLKLLFSRETRDTVGDVLDAIRKSPDWKKDLVVWKGQFTRNTRDEIPVFVDSTCDIVASRDWPPDQVQALHFVLSEMINNAFEHGVPASDNGKVKVVVKLSKGRVFVSVEDPGAGFDLETAIESQRAITNGEARVLTSKALGFIAQLTTSVEQTLSPHTLTATIPKTRGAVDEREIGIATVFGFKGENLPAGYFWTDFVRRLEKTPANRVVILDFNGVGQIGTRTVTALEKALWDHEAKSKRTSGPEFVEFMEEVPASRSVAVCSIGGLVPPIQDYLSNRYPVYPSLEEALRSFGLEGTG